MNNNFINWIVPGQSPEETTKGGQGSGDFGHAGRPGETGGVSTGKQRGSKS